MTLAENCADLARLLPAAAALLTEPDTDGATGSGQPGTRPPWNSQAAAAVLDAHEGVRRLEASMRRDVTGRTGPKRGGSDANTMAAIKAIEALGHAVDDDLQADAARILDRWSRQIRELPAVDEAEPWRRVQGAACPYCGFTMLRVQARSGMVACLRGGVCLDANEQPPRGRMDVSRLTGDPVIYWNDGLVGVTVTGKDDRIERIRELHRPHWRDSLEKSGQVWLACHGCDEGDYAQGPASWPCRTAEIVYTAEEIAIREPRVPECTHDHGSSRDGTPIHPQAVFLRPMGAQLVAARWNCDHVQPVPVEPVDTWDA